MTSGNNGSKTSTATWLAVLISAVSLTFVITYAGATAADEGRMNRMELDIREIKIEVKSANGGVSAKLEALTTEINTRVEKANEVHKQLEVRIDRLENKR